MGGQISDQSQSNSDYRDDEEQATFGVGNLTISTGNRVISFVQGVVHRQHEIEHLKPILPEPHRFWITEPKKGSTGIPIRLVSNYFPIKSSINWILYHYRVNFNPDIYNFYLKKKLIYEHAEKLGPYIFDGFDLYSITKYESEKFELKAKRGKKITITVSFIRIANYDNYVYIQGFNLLLINCLRYLNFRPDERNWYESHFKININRHKLCLWPGYGMKIDLFEGGLMLRVNLTTMVIHQETVYNYYANCIIKNQDGFNVFKQEIIGTKVLTRYNNKIYKIDDVADYINVYSTFLKKDGSQISYVQYYKKKWNLTITEPMQPMLVSKRNKSFENLEREELIYLVPEFCSLTGLTGDMRNNFRLTKDLAEITQFNPKERVDIYNIVMKRIQTLPFCLHPFDTWNLKLGDRLVEFFGRVLPPEIIQPNINCKKSYTGGNQANWSDHICDLPMYTCAQLKQWHFVYPSLNISERAVRNFIINLQQVANKMAFMLPEPKLVQVGDDQVSTYINVLDGICDQYNPSFIMCVVGTTCTDFYIAIKKMLCVTRAIPSQVVLAKNVVENNKTVCTKLAIQMNAKLGGVPWHIVIPPKEMMIVGIDIYQDIEKKKLYGALVATMNKTYTSYFSTVQCFSSDDEFSSHIDTLIISATKKYLDKNKELPSSIVVYRSGVVDGLLGYINGPEVRRIKTMYRQVFKQELPLAFVVVKKNVDTRFFSKSNQDLSNPPPGTVVDKIVTDPYIYDFYLVSHNTNLGTVIPTYYNVLEDTLIDWSPDRMQRLTFKLTHMYFNWSGTVRVPALCQLAYKLAHLSAQIGVPNAELNESLFYL